MPRISKKEKKKKNNIQTLLLKVQKNQTNEIFWPIF